MRKIKKEFISEVKFIEIVFFLDKDYFISGSTENKSGQLSKRCRTAKTQRQFTKLDLPNENK